MLRMRKRGKVKTCQSDWSTKQWASVRLLPQQTDNCPQLRISSIAPLSSRPFASLLTLERLGIHRICRTCTALIIKLFTA